MKGHYSYLLHRPLTANKISIEDTNEQITIKRFDSTYSFKNKSRAYCFRECSKALHGMSAGLDICNPFAYTCLLRKTRPAKDEEKGTIKASLLSQEK